MSAGLELGPSRTPVFTPLVRFEEGYQCPMGPGAGRAGSAAEDFRHLGERQVVVAAEHEDFALMRRQRIECRGECGASSLHRSAIR